MVTFLIQCCSFLTQNLSEILGFFVVLLSSISIFIAYKALTVTSRSFNEHNRPYVTFNIEGERQPGFIFFCIRNTGIRGAKNVKIHITPKPKSYAFLAKGLADKDRSEFSFAFLAPNQTIRTFFDHGSCRYQNNQKPDFEIFNISLTYSHKKKDYNDVYECDISYLGFIMDSSTPSDLSKGLTTIHEDLENITKAISKVDKND